MIDPLMMTQNLWKHHVNEYVVSKSQFTILEILPPFFSREKSIDFDFFHE